MTAVKRVVYSVDAKVVKRVGTMVAKMAAMTVAKDVMLAA